MTEIFSFAIIGVVSVILFFVIRFIDILDKYNYLAFVTKHPQKCKKCHVSFGMVRSCIHAKHTVLTPIIPSVFFAFLFLFSILVIIPYADSLPPVQISEGDLEGLDRRGFTWWDFLKL